MKLTEKTVTTNLRRQGYKMTPQRKAVITTILQSQDHLTPAQIFEAVGRNYPEIGLVTVYRTLELLSRLGLICELHTGGSCPTYTAGKAEHHHHLVCNDCGKVVDFTGHNLEILEDRLTRESGFKIKDHILEFIGVCTDCQSKE